jgi:hypothetical protein
MDDLEHWMVYINQRSEHMKGCHSCKMSSDHMFRECVEYIILSSKIDFAFEKWLSNQYGNSC